MKTTTHAWCIFTPVTEGEAGLYAPRGHPPMPVVHHLRRWPTAGLAIWTSSWYFPSWACPLRSHCFPKKPGLQMQFPSLSHRSDMEPMGLHWHDMQILFLWSHQQLGFTVHRIKYLKKTQISNQESTIKQIKWLISWAKPPRCEESYKLQK